jgi:hypothetical protein
MITTPPLQSALASVRFLLLDLLDRTRDGQGPLAAAVHAELESTKGAHVRAKLLAGDLLSAANSAFASDTFTTAVNAQLRPVISEVVAALAAELSVVQRTGRPLQARVPSGMTSHLPGVYVRQGYINAEDTRELMAAALSDALHVALWICSQKNLARSSTEGFVHYSAGASNFVNRSGMFGPRVRVGTSEDGKPIYDYLWSIRQTLDLDDEAAAHPGDAQTLETFQEERQADGALESLLHTLVSAHLGAPPSRAFTPLFEALCGQPMLDLQQDRPLLQRCAQQARVSPADVQATAEALMQVVRHLRERHAA